jgi:hypothetical protein
MQESRLLQDREMAKKGLIMRRGTQAFVAALVAVVMIVGCTVQAAESTADSSKPIEQKLLREFTFEKGAEGWAAQNQCTLKVENGVMTITSEGNDPFLAFPAPGPGGIITVKLRARCRSKGHGQFFWRSDYVEAYNEKDSVGFSLKHDGQWHEYTVQLNIDGNLQDIRFDPGTDVGIIEVDWLKILRDKPHPLQVIGAFDSAQGITLSVRNASDRAIRFSAGGATFDIDGKETKTVTVPTGTMKPFAVQKLHIQPKDLAAIEENVFVFSSLDRSKMLRRTAGDVDLFCAPDGSGALLEVGGKTVAAISPLVKVKGQVPVFVSANEEGAIVFRGDGVTVRLSLAGGELKIRAEGPRVTGGPSVRAQGHLEQAVFPGLEYLGKGESSSSRNAIVTSDHIRYRPNRMHVTLPLMACVTTRGGVAVAWDDMTLQPVFAAPNFIEKTGDHLMALEGQTVEAVVRVAASGPVEELVLWAVKRHGLPPLPKAPRDPQAQAALCLKALKGPLWNGKGWGHCAEAQWERQPFADMASTMFRLEGKVPNVGALTPGNAHVANNAAFFLTGQAEDWLARMKKGIDGRLSAQQPDGSFRYKGRFQKGHFEDTASGYCAASILGVMEYARITGDTKAIAAGVKTLDYIKRFRTPRGAQTWEIALNAPDILASAYLVKAYVQGYELTGNKAYIVEARRWALSGLPFVYLWGNKPIMTYSTIAVYAASNYRWPLWIGLPVQWCGGVYAYALAMLAPHDKTLDWKHLAEGILIAAEQMQHPEGHKHVGCLPDSLALESQSRNGPDINPCALVSLRLVLDGKVDSLAVASDGKHRVVAPFPVEIRGGSAHIQAPKGISYQVLIDGKRFVNVSSKGEDVVPLEP